MSCLVFALAHVYAQAERDCQGSRRSKHTSQLFNTQLCVKHLNESLLTGRVWDSLIAQQSNAQDFHVII